MSVAAAVAILLSAAPDPEFKSSVERDIKYVAERTGVEKWILRELVRRESSGNHEAVRYCRKWKGKKCVREAACRTNCRQVKKVWDHKLDLGLWQLRHSRTWSWLRWYSRNFERVEPDCALQRHCARRVVVQVILYLQERAENKIRCRQPAYVPELQWLAYWNGCRSYARYVTTWQERNPN